MINYAKLVTSSLWRLEAGHKRNDGTVRTGRLGFSLRRKKIFNLLPTFSSKTLNFLKAHCIKLQKRKANDEDYMNPNMCAAAGQQPSHIYHIIPAASKPFFSAP